MGEEELSRLLNQLRETLVYLKEDGVEGFYMESEGRVKDTMNGREKPKARSKEELLEELKKEVEACFKCEIAKSRTNVVFGEGSPYAEIMFVGEAPGREEDLQGRPFVGRAGKLLTMAIESLGMRREDVFIGNILKCRPPGNRDPLPQEIENCEPFLERQIEIIKPKVICTLGAYAAKTLLKTTAPITILRGKFHDYKGIKLFPTYHPAFILRNPHMKRQFIEDLKKVVEFVKGV